MRAGPHFLWGEDPSLFNTQEAFLCKSRQESLPWPQKWAAYLCFSRAQLFTTSFILGESGWEQSLKNTRCPGPEAHCLLPQFEFLITKHYRLHGLSRIDTYHSQFLRQGSPGSRHQQIGFLRMTCFLFHRWLSSLIRVLIPFLRAPPSRSNHLPKAQPSNTPTLEIGFQHMNWGRESIDIQSIANWGGFDFLTKWRPSCSTYFKEAGGVGRIYSTFWVDVLDISS